MIKLISFIMRTWRSIKDLHMFSKFIRIRYGLVLWGGLGLFVLYILLFYVAGTAITHIQTWDSNKKTREKTVKIEAEKARKYDSITKENKYLRLSQDSTRFSLYKHDLFLTIYDFYKESGTLQQYHWINISLLEEVFNATISSKSLCPSFDTHYFKVFPAEQNAIKTIIIKKYPRVNGEDLEKIIDSEEKRYLGLVYTLMINSKVKRETNYDKKCESINWKKDRWGKFLLDSKGKKIFKSIDQGIVQMNYCGQCGGDYDKCQSIKNKPIGDGYCTRAWAEKKLKTLRPVIASRDVFDIEKNISLRAVHTEWLISNNQAWMFVDWDFFRMCKTVMWKNYYPEMFKLVG